MTHTFLIRRSRRELLEWCKKNICAYRVGGGSVHPRKWRVTSVSERSGKGQTNPALHTVIIADDADAEKFAAAFAKNETGRELAKRGRTAVAQKQLKAI